MNWKYFNLFFFVFGTHFEIVDLVETKDMIYHKLYDN